MSSISMATDRLNACFVKFHELLAHSQLIENTPPKQQYPVSQLQRRPIQFPGAKRQSPDVSAAWICLFLQWKINFNQVMFWHVTFSHPLFLSSFMSLYIYYYGKMVYIIHIRQQWEGILLHHTVGWRTHACNTGMKKREKKNNDKRIFYHDLLHLIQLQLYFLCVRACSLISIYIHKYTYISI